METSEDEYKRIESVNSSDEKFQEKEEKIRLILENNEVSPSPGNIKKLRSLALSEGGLINDDIRKIAWPLLLDLQEEEFEKPPSEEEFKSHPEFSQVVLDVNRSIKRFPPGIPLEQRMAMQDQLVRLILRVIMKYPQLQYYQGYHDVAITFLLVVGENSAFHIMEKLSTNHLKHFMEPTMEKTSELLEYIFPLIDRLHPALCDYLERAEVGAMFCLPWFLTWYSHTLTKYEHVGRLYDYFLVSEPLMPLYLVPLIVVHRQDEIFSTECDMACLHQLLSQLPEDLPFDNLLLQASKLYLKYSPEEIYKEVMSKRLKKETIQQEKRRLWMQQKKMCDKQPVASGFSYRSWQFMQRVLPTWFFPYGKLRFLIFSAGLIIGLYAYYRYFPNTFDFYSLIDEKIISD